MEPRQHSVTEAADAYLDHHGHTEDSYRHVQGVLLKFEFMVNLAVQRALAELPVGAVIIQFPERRT